MRLFLLTICLLILAPVTAHAAVQEVELAGRRTLFWEPERADGVKAPLIIFSHGFLGCGTQSKFLTEALAADGYWVFAPNHDDAACGHTIGSILGSMPKRFAHPDKWDDTTYSGRADNIYDLLTALRQDPKFRNRIDFTRIGLMGHSLGGYTVMGLAGAWPKWKMQGVKAVLALSPFSLPFNIKHTVGGVNIPIMFQGGTRDTAITPDIEKDDGSYAQAQAPKYFVEFKGASHFAWTDMVREYRDSITAYSLAFFDHYVKDLPATPDLTSMRENVQLFRYDSDLGKAE